MTLQLQNPLNIATARLLVEVPGTLFLIWRTSCYLFKHPKDSSKWIWNDIVGPAIPLTWSLRYYWRSCPEHVFLIWSKYTIDSSKWIKKHGRASNPLNIATALILVFPEGFAFHLWGTSFTLFKYPIDLVKWFCDIAAPKPPKHSHCATIGWGPRNILSHLKKILLPFQKPKRFK